MTLSSGQLSWIGFVPVMNTEKITYDERSSFFVCKHKIGVLEE